MLKVRCPNQSCGQTTHLSDDGLGRIFRCPGCQTRLPGTRSTAMAMSKGPARAYGGDDGGSLDDGYLPSDASSIVSDSRTLSLVTPDGTREFGPASYFGRLQVRDEIGSGSFATTYRAFDPLLERNVTLKVYRTNERECSGGIDHFSAESRALAQLRHPRIVPIYDAGREGSYPYIAMEFIDGRTLAEALERAPIDVRHAAAIIAEIAEALHHAHLHGIVHRDVKPSNIVLDPRGLANLIDFGLAHRLGNRQAPSRPGSFSGTLAYVAPEQARGDDAVPDPSNDQYSLGVVLYEMLCGRTPFSGPPLFLLIAAVDYEPPPPRALDPRVPPGLEAICLKALAKRPEERYVSCQALAEDVKRWLGGEPPLALEPDSQSLSQRWVRQMRALAATLTSLLALVLLALGIFPATAP